MEDSKCIYLSTSKISVDRTFRQLPSHKQIKRTRLFSTDEIAIDGYDNYSQFAYYFGGNIVSIDRTSTIITPFNTTLHQSLSLPKDVALVNTFSDCCDERATHILSSGKYVNVMYGGGIDSVTMLTALLKNSTEKQRQSITILMSNDSIERNRKFYDKFICGNFRVVPSTDFTKYLGRRDSFFVTGECGDEIFGTTFTQNLMYRTTMDLMQEEPTLSTILLLLRKTVVVETEQETRNLRNLVDLMFRVAENSPVELDTTYKFLWWLHFCLSWNVSYTRLMGFGDSTVNPEEDYLPFFSTKEFQVWSMNNTDKLSIYKQPAKEYINSYADGVCDSSIVKSTSLSNICYNKPTVFAIDEHNNRIEQVVANFNKQNSFIW